TNVPADTNRGAASERDRKRHEADCIWKKSKIEIDCEACGMTLHISESEVTTLLTMPMAVAAGEEESRKKRGRRSRAACAATFRIFRRPIFSLYGRCGSWRGPRGDKAVHLCERQAEICGFALFDGKRGFVGAD